MNFRPYRDDDFEPLVRLFTEAVHVGAASHYDPVQCAAWAPEPPDLEEWKARFVALQVIVAEEAQQHAGFIAYEPDGHIDLLFTSPSYTRCGVASLLYQQVESALRSTGVEELFTEASLVARQFFERHGFRVVEEQTVRRGGVSFCRYAMRKALG